MTKFLLALTLLASLASADMRNPPSSTERQYLYNKNNLSNGGFEGGETGWSSAINITTTSGQFAEGAQGASWDPSASGTIQSPSWTPKASTTINAVGSCKILTADSDYDLQVWDGTNVVAEVDVPAGTTFTNMNVNFVASGSTTYRIRLEAQGDESVAYIDDCYLGETYNLATVSQSAMYGGIRYAGVASCTWTAANTGGWVDFSADSDCTGRVLSGNATGPADTAGTRTPSVTFSTLPAGNYQVVVTGNILMSNTSGALAFQGVRLSDGTSVFSPPAAVNLPTGDSTRSTAQNLIWNITYDTPQTNKTFKLQANASASGAVDVQTTNANQDFEIKVYRYPLQIQTIVAADQTDVGLTNFTPSYSTVATFGGAITAVTKATTGITVDKGSWRRVSDEMEMFITYSATNTTGGAETAGSILIAMPSGYQIDTGRIDTINSTFFSGGLYDRGTIIGAGIGKNSGTLNNADFIAYPYSADYIIAHVTRQNAFWSTTQVGLRNAAGTVSVTLKLRIPISGWAATQRAPSLINSVITPYVGVWQTLSASFGGASDGTSCGSSPCTVYRPSGSWLSSVTRGGTGLYTFNFVAGTFAQAPNCTYQPHFGTNCGKVNATTTSSVSVDTFGCSSGTTTDSFGVIRCDGPK